MLIDNLNYPISGRKVFSMTPLPSIEVVALYPVSGSLIRKRPTFPGNTKLTLLDHLFVSDLRPFSIHATLE